MTDLIIRWRLIIIAGLVTWAVTFGTLYAITFDTQQVNGNVLNWLDIAQHDTLIQTSTFTIPTANDSDVIIRFESHNRGRMILQQSTGASPGQIMAYRFTVRPLHPGSLSRELADVDLAMPKQLTITRSELQQATNKYQMTIKALKNSAVFRGNFSDSITLSVMDM